MHLDQKKYEGLCQPEPCQESQITHISLENKNTVSMATLYNYMCQCDMHMTDICTLNKPGSKFQPMLTYTQSPVATNVCAFAAVRILEHVPKQKTCQSQHH